MVERVFRHLTQKGLRRGVFRDVEELIAAIGKYIDRHNQTVHLDREGRRHPREIKPARAVLRNWHSA